MEGGKNGIEECYCFLFPPPFFFSCMVLCYNLSLFILNAKNNISTHLGFCDQFKNDYVFFLMFIITCNSKGCQDAMWHHGFATIVYMAI